MADRIRIAEIVGFGTLWLSCVLFTPIIVYNVLRAAAGLDVDAAIVFAVLSGFAATLAGVDVVLFTLLACSAALASKSLKRLIGTRDSENTEET